MFSALTAAAYWFLSGTAGIAFAATLIFSRDDDGDRYSPDCCRSLDNSGDSKDSRDAAYDLADGWGN